MSGARRRRRLYVLLASLAVLVLTLVLVFRGGGGEDSSPAAGDARAAVATVQAFERAVVDRDFAGICDRLFTVDAREASGGGNCQSVLAQNASRIRNPKVQITSVVLRGNAATVAVVAQVAGGQPVSDVIRLVRTQGRYRISSAGSAAGDS